MSLSLPIGDEANALLTRDPLALLIGMVLDQQVPLERAFAAPAVDRIAELPGFGPQRAQIFLALLGKQFGVRPPGWREAPGAYGGEGVYRSVADIPTRRRWSRYGSTSSG